MSTFESKEFIERDKCLLRAFGIDPEGAECIRMSRKSTRREIFKISEANRQKIKETVASISKKHGGVGVGFDHKSVTRHHVNGETSTILGISLQVTDKDGHRHSYLLAFEHTEGETHEEAIRTVKEVLEDFGLLESAQSGHITLSTDYALAGAAKRISFNTSVDPNHSIDRLLKRTTKELLPKFINNAVVELKKTTDLIRNARKCLSKKQLKRHPESTEASLNDYLVSKGVKPIQSYTEVRFRSLHESISSIIGAKSAILELVGDSNDPNHFHAANLPDFAFVEALFDLLEKAFVPLIDYCDSEKTSQCGEYLPEAEFLLQYACSNIHADNEFTETFKNTLVAAVLEQLIGHYILEDETMDSSVRTRLLPNELVAMYGTISRKSCNLEKVQWILKEGKRDDDAKLVKQYAVENKLLDQARLQIKRYDSLINDDSSSILDFDSDDSCLSDDSNQNLFTNPDRSTNSSRSFTSNRTEIEKECDKWENLEISYWKSFKLFANAEGWLYKKSAKGFILQNQHNQKYWRSLVHIFPRLSKIMLFVLNAPCSTSPLERYFSTISMNTSPIAANRTTEYLEQVNQTNSINDKFFEVINELNSSTN